MTFAVNVAQGGSNNTTFRNRIYNGLMMLDQRYAGASVTPTTSQYVLDRWSNVVSQSSKYSVQRSTVAPAGFTNSMLATSLSAYSVGASDYFTLTQFVEGFNAADLCWGTANAQAVTLSFRVRSSLTGTFVVAIRSGADDAAYPATYTISAANTWETKTITVPGPTTGTFATDNGRSFGVWFILGMGSSLQGTANTWAGGAALGVSGAVNVVGTSGATFYITGVQLEAGTTATPFEVRPYGTELALCQRYYSVATTTARFGSYSGIQYFRTTISTPASMRASPTVTKLTNGTLSNTVAGNIVYTSLSQTQFGFEVASSGTGDCYAIGGTASLESEL